MKKLSLVLALVLLFNVIAFSAYAEGDITVKINGNALEFDVPPQLINDRTMVPMRVIFESFGANVEWVDEIQLVLATYGPKIVAMEIGAPAFKITNLETGITDTIDLDSPAVVIDGRTLIPVRAVAECFGYTVGWDDLTQTVIINQ